MVELFNYFSDKEILSEFLPFDVPYFSLYRAMVK